MGGTGWYLNVLNKCYVKKFKAFLTTYQILLNCGTKIGRGLINVEKDRVRKIFEEGLAAAKKKADYKKGDRIRVIVNNASFNNPISTETSSNLNADTILEYIQNIVTSDQKVDLNRTTFDIQIFKMPRGNGNGGRRKIINLAANRLTKRSITRINNVDNLCGARSIIVALTYHMKTILGRKLTNNEIKCVRMGRKLQEVLAEKLCCILGGSYDDGFSLEDFKQIEVKLNVQVKIICAENFNSVIYAGPEKDIKLCLYKNKNHFDVINNMAAFYGSHYYCHKCEKPYSRYHKCKKAPAVCMLCKQPEHDIVSKNKIFCDGCNRYCYNEECLMKHDAVCKVVYKCEGCNKICNRAKEHQCGFSLCPNCKTVVETTNHHCFITKKFAKGGYCSLPCSCNGKSKNKIRGCFSHFKKNPSNCSEPCLCNGTSDEKIQPCTYTEKYIFFDYEAMQINGKHVPNLIVAHYFDGLKFTFQNNIQFCEWLVSENHRGYTAIAHNAKGYDAYFILKYCVENTVKPFTI